ncbi:sulfurtransferase complex subunit TusC [Orbaceae bacterium ESL0727]|nr:sulfurtransferase complex subunit TusC [Orbaceae bacterium ESL0727]
MKKIAVVISHLPHGDAKGREALDIALALSDINQMSLFFEGEGVFHLLPNQQPEKILLRDYIATLKLLALYDIDKVYVDQASLDHYHIPVTAITIPIKIINQATATQLLTEQHAILRF